MARIFRPSIMEKTSTSANLLLSMLLGIAASHSLKTTYNLTSSKLHRPKIIKDDTSFGISTTMSSLYVVYMVPKFMRSQQSLLRHKNPSLGLVIHKKQTYFCRVFSSEIKTILGLLETNNTIEWSKLPQSLRTILTFLLLLICINKTCFWDI